MNVFIISKHTSIFIWTITILIFVIIISSAMTHFNFDNYTPKNYVGVVIDGDDKHFRRMYVDNAPTVNAESTKVIVVDFVNKILNYNSTNFLDVIDSTEEIFDKKYFKSYSKTMYQKIIKDIDNGYHITRSIVSEKPVLLGIAFDGKNLLYRYKLKTSTVYKSEFSPLVTNHNVIVVVKIEDPRDNVKGLSISNISIL